MLSVLPVIYMAYLILVGERALKKIVDPASTSGPIEGLSLPSVRPLAIVPSGLVPANVKGDCVLTSDSGSTR